MMEMDRDGGSSLARVTVSRLPSPGWWHGDLYASNKFFACHDLLSARVENEGGPGAQVWSAGEEEGDRG